MAHQFTPTYSPQCYPVERTNRVLKTMISSYLRNRSHRYWDDFLSEIQFAYNTSVHEGTGFSPDQLNFGRKLFTTGTLFAEWELKDNQKPDSPEEKSQRITEMIKLFKINLKNATMTCPKKIEARNDHQETRGENQQNTCMLPGPGIYEPFYFTS